ncbi:hypothetical protein C8R43DRAFT_951490 [Mycena crocata]|nr:hypothetical protein C8R43DRAFT_951490 [Mycena crocata]
MVLRVAANDPVAEPNAARAAPANKKCARYSDEKVVLGSAGNVRGLSEPRTVNRALTFLDSESGSEKLGAVTSAEGTNLVIQSTPAHLLKCYSAEGRQLTHAPFFPAATTQFQRVHIVSLDDLTNAMQHDAARCTSNASGTSTSSWLVALLLSIRLSSTKIMLHTLREREFVPRTCYGTQPQSYVALRNATIFCRHYVVLQEDCIYYLALRKATSATSATEITSAATKSYNANPVLLMPIWIYLPKKGRAEWMEYTTRRWNDSFMEYFRNNLLDIGIDPRPYGTHSFREVAASTLRWFCAGPFAISVLGGVCPVGHPKFLQPAGLISLTEDSQSIRLGVIILVQSETCIFFNCPTDKSSLKALIERQLEKWPDPTFKPKHITAQRMRSVLADQQYRFTHSISTTEVPESPLSASVPSEIGSRKSSAAPEANLISCQEREPNVRLVKLLIEDCRFSRSTKISQEVALVVVDALQCGPGEWRVDLCNLLEELQNTNAALSGSVKLAIRDSEYPDHRVYFVKVTDDALLEEAQPSPQLATIASNGCLEIFVEQAEDTYYHMYSNLVQAGPFQRDGSTESNDIFDVDDPNAKPLDHARRRAVKKSKPPANNGDVQWLTAEIKALPGYSDYDEHRRKVQHNPGVVSSWKFMALVSETYYKQPSHIVGRQNKKIQKQSIEKALGVGSTSLAAAVNAVRILKRYGDGGTSPAQTVIERVALNEGKPQGAKVLYPFLVDWEKSQRTSS